MPYLLHAEAQQKRIVQSTPVERTNSFGIQRQNSKPAKLVEKTLMKSLEIKSLEELIEKDYSCLIVLLITLAPEVIFKMKNLYAA